MATSQSTKSTLIYIGDPMCSWCYGLSDELSTVLEHYEGTLDYELVMGGLRPYNTETMSDLKDFLTHHWEDVHQASGQEFDYQILDDDTITYDTEPPSRAVMIVRELDASVGFEFFKLVQKTFYKENRNMHLVESYFDIVEEVGLDIDIFKSKFESDVAKVAIRSDFNRSSELGVRSFPTILLIKDGKQIVVARGYATSKKIIENIDQILHNNIKSS